MDDGTIPRACAGPTPRPRLLAHLGELIDGSDTWTARRRDMIFNGPARVSPRPRARRRARRSRSRRTLLTPPGTAHAYGSVE